MEIEEFENLRNQIIEKWNLLPIPTMSECNHNYCHIVYHDFGGETTMDKQYAPWVVHYANNNLYFYKELQSIEMFLNRVQDTLLDYEDCMSKIKQNADDLPFLAIPISKIYSYQLIGDKHITSEISGGGGGGSSIGGAILGGVIAGGAGAIIGSRKKYDQITTETKIVDERSVLLKYYDEEDKLTTLQISPNIFEIFNKWFPEKEASYVASQSVAQTFVIDTKERLKKLQELEREGLISEEEYTTKRQKILDEV